MSRKLNELLDKYAWNSLQIQQLRLADKKNLDLSFFNPQYDWEQLREIRLALEDGLDPSFLLDKHINSDSMQKSRETIYKMSGQFDKNREIAKSKKLKRIIITVIFVFIIMISIILGVWKKEYIFQMVSGLELELIDTHYKLKLSELNNFHFTDLIKNYSNDAELILPKHNIDTVGEYNLTYEIRNEMKSLKKTILVTVVDDIKPTLTLKKDAISLSYGMSFNARDYIKVAKDNVDGDMTSEVKISSDVNTTRPKTYTVIYTLSDHSNNTVKSKLLVTVNEKEKAIQSSNHNSTYDNKKSSTNQSSSHKSSAINVTAENKTFLFTDYGEATKTEQAALSYAQNALNNHLANGYRCNPVKQNDIYIGYEVIFN